VNRDFDSYACWMLQYIKRIRKDVVVIEVGQFIINEFRTKIQQELNIAPFTAKISDYSNYRQFKKEYLH